MAGLNRKNRYYHYPCIWFLLVGNFLFLSPLGSRFQALKIELPLQVKNQRRIPIKDDTRDKAGLFSTHSLCRMSRWLYTENTNKPGTPRFKFECNASFHNLSEQLLSSAQLEEHDTVFVPFTAIETFVENILGNLTVVIVVISGQTRNTRPAAESAIVSILEHPRILRWFCQNLSVYGGSYPLHPKIRPFAYGLRTHTLRYYKKIFFESLKNSTVTEKSDSFIFAGHITMTNSVRMDITRSSKMAPAAYYSRMAKSRYILSPDGDRPECYRHYEALGLGTMPITSLDPALFYHFGPKNVVYNTSTWNVTELEGTLDPMPEVNRNLVREAYWMEWANGEAGVGLTWNSYANGNGLSVEETTLLASMDWPVHSRA